VEGWIVAGSEEDRGGVTAPEAQPEGTLSRQIDELRRQLAAAPVEDVLRRRVEVIGALAAAFEEQLRSTRRNLRQLEDLFLPVCMFCKRVRTDDSYWEKIERFFTRHADVTFSHGICPTCFEERFGAIGASAPAGEAPAAAAPAAPTAEPRPDGAEEDALQELRTILEEAETSGALPAGPALWRAVDRIGRAFGRYRKVVERSDGYQEEFRRRLEHAVRSDALTGFTTRAAAIEVLEDAFDRSRRGDGAEALVVVEVRGLRALNQRRGYASGDRAIVALSRALRAAAPGARLRARWSGNAFALIVDAAAAPAALHAALQAVVASSADDALSLTVEAGLAYALDAADAAAWVAAAEGAVAPPPSTAPGA
jgi:diguanylate cyclase (GGDEF)-like protein